MFFLVYFCIHNFILNFIFVKYWGRVGKVFHLITVENIEDVCESENDGMEEDREICESKDHESENSEQETELYTLLNDNTFTTQQVSKL